MAGSRSDPDLNATIGLGSPFAFRSRFDREPAIWTVKSRSDPDLNVSRLFGQPSRVRIRI